MTVSTDGASTPSSQPVVTIFGYEIHPAAELFPMMGRADFDALVEDIATNGMIEPVVLDAAGHVIDGRNRLKACERLGTVPVTKVYDGDDVWSFVVSINLNRRHLSDSQRAMVAAKLATRQRGGVGGLDPAMGSSTHCPPPSVPQAAKTLSVSDTATKLARRVLREGTPELADLVSEGTVTVGTAARVTDEFSRVEQDEFVEAVRAGADPIKVAPKKDTPVKAPTPKYAGLAGTRRNHRQILDALLDGLAGYVIALNEITELDGSVTAEEATRITGDLSKQIGALRRILNQLTNRRERTS